MLLRTRTRLLIYKHISRSNQSSSSLSKLNLNPHFIQTKNNHNQSNNFLVFCNNQITKNGREGNINEAESVFHRMPNKNIVSFTAMLSAYAQNNQIDKARKVFDEMRERNIVSYNAMITGYIRSGGLMMVGEAFALFESMPERNSVSYAGMITGFVKAGMLDKAEKLFSETPVKWRDPACSNALISGYLGLGRLDEAVGVFNGMAEKSVVSWTCIIDGYCKEGLVVEARELFDKMPERNVVCWTAMINGYMKWGFFYNGFEMFLKMRREGSVEVNPTTLTIMFEACGNFDRIKEGIQIHKLVLGLGFDFEVFLGNSVITMYSHFGCLNEASKVFLVMSRRDLVSWNSMIAGYIQNKGIEEAYKLFQNMPHKDVVSWTTMISGFFMIGKIEKSIELFEKMPEKDDVAWTALISGFLENGQYEEAIHCFIKMLREPIRPNNLTLSSVLGASAGLATLSEGIQIHAYLLKIDTKNDLAIQNSLVSMYSKCGNVADAYKIFSKSHNPDIVSFNSMITGFAQNGFSDEALKLFKNMQNEGQTPNDITFLGVLSACTHAGLVQKGWDFFKSMSSIYSIEPGPNHYACMVDLLGRAGKLDEAIILINAMPFEANAGVWGALLGASKNHFNLDIAKLAAEQLFILEPDNVTPYVVLSNMFSLAGKTRNEELVRITKKRKKLSKSPGSSWISVT